ncbi:MAG: response regulator [Nocardioidaceae bacterium]
MIRVLVVEDEAVASQAHASYVGRIDGFELAGICRSGSEALRHLQKDNRVDLLLLDMYLPDAHGLDLLQRIRTAGNMCDVIAVTSARDVEIVKHAVAQGVVQYLLKPFTFAGFRAKLEQYAAYRAQLTSTDTEVVQDEVDQLLGLLRASGSPNSLPKGMSPDTMRMVTGALRTSEFPLSATEVAEVIGASRVTARRYLEHLADAGLVVRQPRYGRGGRPEGEYSWGRR